MAEKRWIDMSEEEQKAYTLTDRDKQLAKELTNASSPLAKHKGMYNCGGMITFRSG